MSDRLGTPPYPKTFVQQALRFACQMLLNDGEFFPYAEFITTEGEGGCLGTQFRSRIGHEIDRESGAFYETLVNKAAKCEIVASAVVTNRSRRQGARMIDSVCIDTETREGFSAFVLFDYELADGAIDLSAPVLIAHSPRVFV